jgi:vanillate/3-O-methylgallate O-demethylase
MSTSVTFSNVEDLMELRQGPIGMLRSSQLGSYAFPGVPSEYTNWRDEQRAWQQSCALLNLSFHQTYLYLEGPDAQEVLGQVAVNKLNGFSVNRGKQLVTCGHDGYLIADGICLHLGEDLFRVSGAPVISNWVQYNAQTSGLNVSCDRDETIAFRSGDPRNYIYQIQGPFAQQLMTEITGGALPSIGFFSIGDLLIEGCKVKALRHGMAGQPGYEIFGPWGDSDKVMAALERLGKKYHLRKVGSAAYPTSALESGWMPLPVPAIYHTDQMKPYRKWLTPKNLEAMGSLGGSFVSNNIIDYYMDPIEVGYGRFIDFDRDFIGRDALRRRKREQRRTKVTLVWNEDDATDIIKSSLFDTPYGAKFINTPLSMYSTFHYDQILKDGVHAGVAQLSGYSANAGKFLTVSLINTEFSAPGTEVTLIWGEPDSARPVVEQHKVKEIRATVAPAPFFQKTIKV